MTSLASYLKLFVDCLEKYQKLSDSEFGRLVRAALRYKATGAEPTDLGREELLWDGIKLDIDRDTEKYANVVADRSEAGKKGGRPKKQKKQMLFEESKKSQDKEEDKDKDKEEEYPIVPRDFDDLCGLCVSDNARVAQEEVANWLEKRGYSCTLEVPVADRGDGRSGRVDLMAERDGNQVAIEIDRDSPREKSLVKLRQFACAKVVVVRNGAGKGSRTTPDGIKICNLTCDRDDGFERFWEAYPKKRSKGAARKAWDKLHVDATLQEKILQAVERGKQSKDWKKDGGKYIPYPSTWLNAEGWEDKYADLATSYESFDIDEVEQLSKFDVPEGL